MNILNKNYQELANAIVIQAVKDYKRGLRGTTSHAKWTVEECEMFFRSEWFSLLTRVDEEMLIQRIKQEVQNGRRTRSKHTKTYRDRI